MLVVNRMFLAESFGQWVAKTLQLTTKGFIYAFSRHESQWPSRNGWLCNGQVFEDYCSVFQPTRDVRMQWARAFSLVCEEVALREHGCLTTYIFFLMNGTNVIQIGGFGRKIWEHFPCTFKLQVGVFTLTANFHHLLNPQRQLSIQYVMLHLRIITYIARILLLNFSICHAWRRLTFKIWVKRAIDWGDFWA